MTKLSINLTPKNKMNYNQFPNHEFCFALLDKDNQVLHTPFMCKDYLSDIFWVERTGSDEIKKYGLVWKKGMLGDTSRFRLAITGGEENMEERIPLIQEFLNKFEEAQNIPPSIVLDTDDKTVIVIDFDTLWTTSGPMLSAFTSLIRVCGAFNGGDPVEYLQEIGKKDLGNLKPEYSQVEVQRLKLTLPKFLKLMEGKKLDCDWSVSKDVNHAHDYGIMYYKGEFK